MEIQNVIKQCKQGDRLAEKKLFFHFAGKVRSICRRYSNSSQEAKDLMQECFLKIFSNIGKYDEKKGAIEGWIYQVSTNRILEILRKEKRGIKVVYMAELPEESEEIAEDLLNRISSADLLQCIKELPNGYRNVLNLFIFEGFPHARIARELGITESTSRSQYTRAKKLLKEKIKNKKEQRYERC